MRESASVGSLGVRTLGYHVDAAISERRLDVALVLVVATEALSIGLDAFSRAPRRRLRLDGGRRSRTTGADPALMARPSEG